VTTNIYFYHISLSSSWKEKCFRQNVVEKIKTHIMSSNFFFPKILPFVR